MKSIKLILALVAVAAGALSSESALAHGRGHAHIRFGFFVGAPVIWHWQVPPPYYYAPRVVVTPAAPVYIERDPAQTEPVQGYWYYCAEAGAYYPYVKNCPGAWQRVAPQPPPDQPVR